MMVLQRILRFAVECLTGGKLTPQQKRNLTIKKMILILGVCLSVSLNFYLYNNLKTWKNGYKDIKNAYHLSKENNDRLIKLNTRLYYINSKLIDIEINVVRNANEVLSGSDGFKFVPIINPEKIEELTLIGKEVAEMCSPYYLNKDKRKELAELRKREAKVNKITKKVLKETQTEKLNDN